jgi:hypothetical protein
LWASHNRSIKSIVYYDIGVDNSGEEIRDKVDENMDFLLYIDTHDGRQFRKEVELQRSVLTHHAKKEDLYRLKKFTTKIHKIRYLIENHGYLIYHHWAYILLMKHTGLSHMLNNYRQKSGYHWNNRQPSIQITGKELYNDFIQNGLMQYLEFHPDQIEYNKSIYG